MKRTLIILCSCFLEIAHASKLTIDDYSAKKVSFGADEMHINGSLKADEEIIIDDTNLLLGSGKIEAPRIVIDVHQFNFTGKITCQKECKISSMNSIDPLLCKMTGAGAFILTLKKRFDDEGNEY